MAANNEPISIWTAADEARLVELQNRRTEIMAARRSPLIAELDAAGFHGNEASVVADALIPRAERLRDLLAPFDGRKP